MKKLNTEIFVSRAKLVHGDKYDYSKSQYTHSKKGIIVICKKCGEEWITTPSAHLNGNGCKECYYKRLSEQQTFSNDEFVEKSKEIHGDKFDYLSIYENKRAKVKIRCRTCGTVFWQEAGSHRRGTGCRTCNLSPECTPLEIVSL